MNTYAIYARYSTNMQNEKSIEDQVQGNIITFTEIGKNYELTSGAARDQLHTHVKTAA